MAGREHHRAETVRPDPGRWVVWGAVVLAFHLVAVSLLDPIKNIWPPKGGDLLWRLVLGAQFLNSVGLLVAAVALLALVAYIRRVPAGLILVAVLGTVAAVGIGAAVLLTLLDFLQVRSTLLQQHQAEWDRNVLLPLVAGVLATMALSVLVLGVLTAAQRVGAARPKGPPKPPVVGR